MLGEVLSRLPQISLTGGQVNHLIDFFVERLGDSPSQDGCLRALAALLRNHLPLVLEDKASIITKSLFLNIPVQSLHQAVR